MKRIIYILLMAIGMAVVAPVASVVDHRVAAVYAADDKAKAKAKAKAQREREKAKAQKQREREKAKAQAQREKDKAAAQKKKQQEQRQKELAKAKAQKQKQQQAGKPAKAKSEPELTAAEEKARYMSQLKAVEKSNARAEAYNSRDIAHRLGFWGQAGYSNLFTSGIAFDPTTVNPTGFQHKDNGLAGGGLGVGYQLRYRQFLFTTGVEFMMYNSVMSFSNQPDGTMLLHYGMQPYANTMSYHYAFSGMQDKLLSGSAQIPLLFGMELNRIPLFWQAGVKAGIGVWGSSTISGMMSTSITDTELIIDLEKMYGHTLVENMPVERAAQPFKLGLNLAATAEIGVNFDRWIQAGRLRLSVFADYGVLNALGYQPAAGAQDIPMQMMVAANPLDFPVNSTLQTTSAAKATVNPFLVGAKIAMWFDLPRKQKQMQEPPVAPLPRMAVSLNDDNTSLALGGAAVEVVSLSSGKSIQKNTNRQGLVKGRFAAGEYRISATKTGYLPSDTIIRSVEEFTYDTLRLAMQRIQEPIIPTLCFNIYDIETREPVEASVRVVAMRDTTEHYLAQSSDDGFVETPFTAGDYIAHLSAAGYMSKDDTLHFVSDTLDVFMQHIKPGIKVKIENLFFATNKTYILPQSEQSMSDLAAFLLENPGVTIHITGHTDAVGSDEANQILSEGRANAVRQNLIDRGVAAERMTAEGKGEKEPVADNDTESGRQLNRRVEFVITGTDGKDIEQIF